jgi:hypothetical protein
MKRIKGILVTGLILLGCFETLQFFNRQDALSVGKNFLKTHNATVESIDCGVPSLSFSVIDRSTKFCTFNATPEQIQVLIKFLDFRPINPVKLSIEESINNDKELEKKFKNKAVVEAIIQRKELDEVRSSSIEKNICWDTLNLRNRSELELYGTFENKESEFSSTFYVFYNKISKTGCVRFVTMDGKIS